MSERPLTIWLVAGEESGDQLGAKLIRSLRGLSDRPFTLAGVGGDAMAAEGMESLFPLEDVAVIGYLAVAARIRLLMRRIRQTVRACVAARPDVLVIIDSPASPMRWRAGCAGSCRVSPWSITSARASGPGARGGRRPCAATSTTCSPCCRSSPTPIAASMVRPAPMSATR